MTKLMMINPPAAPATGRLGIEPPDVGGVDIGIVFEVTDADCVIESEAVDPFSEAAADAVGLVVLVTVIPTLP